MQGHNKIIRIPLHFVAQQQSVQTTIMDPLKNEPLIRSVLSQSFGQT